MELCKRDSRPKGTFVPFYYFSEHWHVQVDVQTTNHWCHPCVCNDPIDIFVLWVFSLEQRRALGPFLVELIVRKEIEMDRCCYQIRGSLLWLEQPMAHYDAIVWDGRSQFRSTMNLPSANKGKQSSSHCIFVTFEHSIKKSLSLISLKHHYWKWQIRSKKKQNHRGEAEETIFKIFCWLNFALLIVAFLRRHWLKTRSRANRNPTMRRTFRTKVERNFVEKARKIDPLKSSNCTKCVEVEV